MPDTDVTVWAAFKPDNSITQLPRTNMPFTDVLTTDWYYKDVKIAYQSHLIDGKSSTIFAPEENLTYAQAVKLAACMHQKYTTGSVTLGNGTPWYQTYVDYCKELTATFANSKNNNRLTMVFRVYDNAVAFRYVKSVATGNKNVPLSCPATGTGAKRVTASLRLKSGKNKITLLQEEGKSMEIMKLQAGFVCDGKKH